MQHTQSRKREREVCAAFTSWATEFKTLHTKSLKKGYVFNIRIFVYLICTVYCKNSQNWNFKKDEEILKTWCF